MRETFKQCDALRGKFWRQIFYILALLENLWMRESCAMRKSFISIQLKGSEFIRYRFVCVQFHDLVRWLMRFELKIRSKNIVFSSLHSINISF